MSKRLMCILAAALLAAPALAHDYSVGALKTGNPWARATAKGAQIGGGYLAITNIGSEPDRLVTDSTSVAKNSKFTK